MNDTQKMYLILEYLSEIDALQPWTLKCSFDFSPIQDLQDALNQYLNADVFDD